MNFYIDFLRCAVPSKVVTVMLAVAPADRVPVAISVQRVAGPPPSGTTTLDGAANLTVTTEGGK